MISELLNTVCRIDRDYKISSHVKNMMVVVKEVQPLIIVGIGYYQYVRLFSKFIF